VGSLCRLLALSGIQDPPRMTTPTAIADPRAASPPESARSLAGRAIRGGTVLMVGRLVVQLFVWGVTLGVARLLTPFDYGMMTAGTIFLGLSDFFADAGLGRAIVQKQTLERDDVSRAFTLSLILSLALYGVLFVAAIPAALLLDLPGFVPFLRVLGLLLLLTPLRSISVALLDRNLLLGRQATANVSASMVQAGIVLGLALAGAGYWALTVGAIAGRLLEVGLMVWFARWRPALAWPGRGDGLLSFGVHVSLATLLWYVYSNADFLVVGYLFGGATLGAYALAFQLMSLPVQKLTANVNQVVYPVFCRLQHDRPRLRDWFLRLSVLLGFLGVPILAGMALVAPDACRLLLGDRWEEAIVPLQLLAAVGSVMVYSNALPPLLNALGRPELNARYAAACLLVMPLGFVVGGRVGSTLGGKDAGLVGVCVAWLVLYPLVAGGFVVLTRSVSGVGLWDLFRAQLPILAGVSLMILAVLAVRWSLPGDETPRAWGRFGLSVLTGVAVYGGFMLFFARRTVLADLGQLYRQLRGKAE
jgi:teichuronic acid exporter